MLKNIFKKVSRSPGLHTMSQVPNAHSQVPPVNDGPSIEEQQIYFSIWSKAVDTQMHFNDMSARSRQFGLGFVTATLGFGVALLSQKDNFIIPVGVFGFQFQVHLMVFFILASILALKSVKRLDLHVYHKMLRGSVAFGEDLEERYIKKIIQVEKGMTQAISFFSRHEDAKFNLLTENQKYTGISEKKAYEKILGFYNLATYCLYVLAIIAAMPSNGII